jgi:hypothetical protein
MFGQMEAERAFARAKRAHRRARLSCLVRFQKACALGVYDPSAASRDRTPGVRELPLAAITGTVEPNRAAQFDRSFRPRRTTGGRWQRVWLAEQLGRVLPPIAVVPVGNGYAVRDGHHRVSVALARGALTIDAVVDAG